MPSLVVQIGLVTKRHTVQVTAKRLLGECCKCNGVAGIGDVIKIQALGGELS
jgi:hypothetical protein